MKALLAADTQSLELSRSEFIFTRKCNHLLEELHDMFIVIATFAKAHKEFNTSRMIEELLTKEVKNPLRYYRVPGGKS